VQAELIPLDILILLDRSGSMYGTNWDGSVNALTSFVNAPTSAGISTGIVYYPLDSVPYDEQCDYTLYDVPVVDMGELPANAAAMVSSLQAEDPNGGTTPTYGALKGTLFWATAYQDANPNRKVIVVLATDGAPNSCPSSPVDQNSTAQIGNLAASALNYNGVQTFVVAIDGSNVAALNQIAAAGGTGMAFDVTSNINAFSDKMEEIRKQALACEFNIPEPPMGDQVDPEKVAVKYTPGGSDMGMEIPKTTNFGSCGSSDGWYYDNDASRRRSSSARAPATPSSKTARPRSTCSSAASPTSTSRGARVPAKTVGPPTVGSPTVGPPTVGPPTVGPQRGAPLLPPPLGAGGWGGGGGVPRGSVGPPYWTLRMT
jgi:hypothetical protein